MTFIKNAKLDKGEQRIEEKYADKVKEGTWSPPGGYTLLNERFIEVSSGLSYVWLFGVEDNPDSDEWFAKKSPDYYFVRAVEFESPYENGTLTRVRVIIEAYYIQSKTKESIVKHVEISFHECLKYLAVRHWGGLREMLNAMRNV